MKTFASKQTYAQVVGYVHKSAHKKLLERPKMNDKILNCVICGVGGQGNVLASRLIAHILMERGEHVKTAETIGMAQRGGSVASHVRGGRPFSPLVPKNSANLLIAFEPAEAVRCLNYLSPCGNIVVNTQAVQPTSAALTGSKYDGVEELECLREVNKLNDGVNLIEVDGKFYCEQIGTSRVLNICMLAAACKHRLLPFGREELEDAVCNMVKKRFQKLNLQAIDNVFLS